MNSNKKYKILLTGGGTGGSVSPLLAIYDELKVDEVFEFLWLGGKSGPEREMVENAGMKFKAISGGKLRRYFSWENLFDLFKIELGFWQAFFIMLKWRPNLVMSAGSFLSVPVIWAAWLLRVPVMAHQQDVVPGLANKLMAPFSKIVTVTFEKSLSDYGKKAIWTGNPIRNFQSSDYNFKLNSGMPIVLILGGGTGAKAINELVEKNLNELTKFCQIIHVTGKNKASNEKISAVNYHKYEFLNSGEMAAAMQAADLVITRAGMGTLTELSYLAKPTVIIPMPDSHQEANAEFFKNQKAAIVINQKDLNPASFTHLIKDLLADQAMRAKLSERMKSAMKANANQAMTKIIYGFFQN